MDWTIQVGAYATVAQAVASIVALGIAVAAVIIPARQQHRRDLAADLKERLEAKCLATAIRFDLHDLNVTLSNWKLIALKRSDPSSPQTGWLPDFQVARVEIPTILTASLDRIHILGDPRGPLLLRLIAILNAYNGAVDLAVNVGMSNPAIPPIEHWRKLVGFIDDVLPKIAEALKDVSVVADG